MEKVILIIEDDQMIQRLLSRMIKRSGFAGQTEIFDNSEEVFTFVRQSEDQIVLALMDTSIHPNGDAALAQELLKLCPEINLVASSGHSEEDLRGPQHFGGIDLVAVLSKPFGMQDVKDLLVSLNLI
ncbi:MAG: hypothetical protein CMH49_06610 [Myxococcales bacterium]|nr:hypothetical protein [Myxococcales bacterium]